MTDPEQIERARDWAQAQEYARHMTPQDRRLLVKAIAIIESDEAPEGSERMYAWNRVWRAVDEAEGLDDGE